MTDLIFADDARATPRPEGRPWTLLVVDDEEDVHNVTRIALRGVVFEGRPVRLLSAYSGREGAAILRNEPDIALVLLDVVMETDDAGLRLVREIREEMGNALVRIVLRTGQPGQAPERSVIATYDINDYKAKNELTATKLYTLVLSSLRSYRDLRSIERNKRGLEQIINASATIFQLGSMERFASGVLEQLTSLLRLDDDAVYLGTEKIAARSLGGRLEVLAAAGRFAPLVGTDGRETLPHDVVEELERALFERRTICGDGRLTSYCASPKVDGDDEFGGSVGREAALLHLRGVHKLDATERRLVEIFSRNVGISFHNILLKQDIENTQREIVYLLSESVETRSRETGNHVKRVAKFAKLLGLGYGLTEDEAAILEMAAPLHDLGKIGIPDAILNKPGPHTPEEWAIMQTHATLGYELLRHSRRPVLQAGAIIAHQHHERYDGTGYPNRLVGDAIHPYGRIGALADVFDALASDRCYKQAWPIDQVMAYIIQQRGGHFDPKLVDILVDQLDAFLQVRDQFPDIEHPAS